MSSQPIGTLRAIRLVHTIVWAFFAGCIIALPVFGALGEFRIAWFLAGVVSVELVILALNGGSCPLTAVAARYTADRRANFDIYLPEWLARYNKMIFGTLLVLGLAFTAIRWRMAR